MTTVAATTTIITIEIIIVFHNDSNNGSSNRHKVETMNNKHHPERTIMMSDDHLHGGLSRSLGVLKGPATNKVNPEYIGDSVAIEFAQDVTQWCSVCRGA